MAKVFVTPKTISAVSSITLKHPKESVPCVYFIEPTSGTIYEVNQKQNDHNSWFAGERIVKDGAIYTMTKIDPLFLLLPYIVEKKDRSQNLYDILFENNFKSSAIEMLMNVFKVDLLNNIADTQVFEDDLFVKFNNTKTMRWLSAKFEQIKAALLANNIGKSLMGFSIASYNAGGETITEDEYKILAFELLSDYISHDLAKSLKQTLSIKDKSELIAAGPEVPVTNKRKLDSVEAEDAAAAVVVVVDDYEKEYDMLKKAKNETARSKPTINPAGMKSIASYFTKK